MTNEEISEIEEIEEIDDNIELSEEFDDSDLEINLNEIDTVEIEKIAPSDINIDKIRILIEKDKEKNEFIYSDKILQEEILERLVSLTKKDFFMSVINTNTSINKKFSFKQIQETQNIETFLKDYNILNGFYRFLPTFKTKRIKELHDNVNECGKIIQEITQDYIPLIKNIIGTNFLKRYPFISNNFNELYAGGINGLIVAMYKFDPSKNVKFITHAYRWIIYYIFREMDDIVKVYNEKLYDDDSFFDTIADENFEDNMIISMEIEKIINVDMLDNFERTFILDALQEKIKIDDLDYTLEKIKAIIDKSPKNLANYIRA